MFIHINLLDAESTASVALDITQMPVYMGNYRSTRGLRARVECVQRRKHFYFVYMHTRAYGK